MNWDQIEDNWVAMTRRMRPATNVCGAARGVQPDGKGTLVNELAQTVAVDLKPFPTEVK